MNTIVVTDPMKLEEKVQEAIRTNSVLLIEDIDAFAKVYDADTMCDILDGVKTYDKEEYDWVQKSKKALMEE